MKRSFVILLMMAHVPMLMGKRNRHNRDAAKKPEKEQNCVADFCLPHNYNSLELPSSDKQFVDINLEVSWLLTLGKEKVAGINGIRIVFCVKNSV